MSKKLPMTAEQKAQHAARMKKYLNSPQIKRVSLILHNDLYNAITAWVEERNRATFRHGRDAVTVHGACVSALNRDPASVFASRPLFFSLGRIRRILSEHS